MPETAPAALAELLPVWLDDVAVEFGPVPVEPAAAVSGVLWAAAPGRLWLEVPGVARYLSADGRSLTVEPESGVELAALARFARGTPLAALCYQRGMAVLHAATAVRDGEAVMLAGGSAAGKSTLLAALVARGWNMLGDEVAPLDCNEAGVAVVWPTFADIRLWPDALGRVKREPRLAKMWLLEAPGPASGPQHLTAGHCLLDAPAPIRSIWSLSVHDEPSVVVSDVKGFDRFEALGRLAYHGRVAHAQLDRIGHLQIAASIAAGVQVRKMWRPNGSWSLQELADIVEQDRAGGSGLAD